MTTFVNWPDLGILPLQDHDPKVGKQLPISQRLQVVGGRVAGLSTPDSSSDPRDGVPEYARENGKGTLGDLHPWAFWQTKDRGLRGTGSWSMAFAGLTTGGGTGGIGKGGTGTKIGPSTVQPIRFGDASADMRYAPKTPGWPECFSTLPQGVMTMVMPTTHEGPTTEVMLYADPRLFAPSTSGPGEAGTLVVDLQPNGEPCMFDPGPRGGSPGKQGRAAQLQSMMRVIAMPRGTAVLPDAQPGNALAWNLSLSRQDGLIGYGLCFAQFEKAKGPITTGGTSQRPQNGSQFSGSGSGVAPGIGRDVPGAPIIIRDGGGSGGGGASGSKARPCDYGAYKPKGEANHGLGFMAHVGGKGPFTIGGGNDKHRRGTDRDGHPINSGHISTEALFYDDPRRDGALHFEDDYPNPPELKLISKVHLTWDDGLDRWRWYAEVPYVIPGGPTTGGGITKTPKGPTTTGGRSRPPVPTPTSGRKPGPTTPGGPGFAPRPGGPTTGGGPGGGGGGGTGGPVTGGTGGSGRFGGLTKREQELWDRYHRSNVNRGPQHLGKVGDLDAGDRSLFLIHHPMMESFGELAFRPQLTVDGEPAFTHNGGASLPGSYLDELSRPQVLAQRSWGAQTDSGEWGYTVRPSASRARGGTADGGILFSPPEFELEDYFGINSAADVTSPATTSHVMLAPGVKLTFGVPNSDGGAGARGITFEQTQVAGIDIFRMSQLNASRTAVTLMEAQVDTVSGGVLVDLGTGGNQAVRIPRGTSAQQPDPSDGEIGPTGGEIRISTNVFSGVDTPEFFDATLSSWEALDVSGRFVDIDGVASAPSAPGTDTVRLYVLLESGVPHLRALFDDGTDVSIASQS